MHELLDMLHCVTRSGRKTSEFALALAYVLGVPALDAAVAAVRDVLEARQAAAVTGAPWWVSVAFAACAAFVVAAYALGRGYMKGTTAAAVARAIGDVRLGAGSVTGEPTPPEPVIPEATQ